MYTHILTYIHTYIQVYETRLFHTHKESVGSTYNDSSNMSVSNFRAKRVRGEPSHVAAFAPGAVREILRSPALLLECYSG
jgi:hypothetical protein